MYPQNGEDPTKCDNNEEVTGYELYVVSIIVYLLSLIFVIYTLVYMFASSSRNPQTDEVKLMNRICLALSLTTIFGLADLNPCYDPTAALDSRKGNHNLLVDWQHHEKSFLIGIAIKNIADAVLLLLLTNPKVSKKLDQINCSKRPPEQK